MMTTTDDDGTAPAVGEYAAWSAKLADLLDQAGFVPEPDAGLPVATACQITTPAGPWVFGGDAAVVAVPWDPDEHRYEGPQVAVECDQWSVLFGYGTDPAVIAAVAERMAWDEHGQDEDPAALARVLTSVGFALTTTYPDGEAIPATDQPTWMRVYDTDSNEPQAAFVSPPTGERRNGRGSRDFGDVQPRHARRSNRPDGRVRSGR
jgi:hypothetical protein